MTQYPDTQLFIDGEWGPAAAGGLLPVLNPATGEQIGSLARAERVDLDRALAAADRGFRRWRHTSAYDRAKIMRAAANLVRERAEAIARLMTLEQGKPLAESRMETLAGADIIDWFAGEAPRAYGRVIPSRASHVLQTVVKEPVGPVAAFAPWNFPINQIVRKVSAALAAGCSIIAKGPEETPASPAELVQGLRRCRRAGRRDQPCLRRSGRDFLLSHSASGDPQDHLHGLDTRGQEARGHGGRAHEARDDGTGWACPGDRL